MSAGIPGPRLLDGKYQLEKRLGRGGMGSVYQALHLGLNRLFALKLVLPSHAGDASFQAFFRAEALALGRLRHPGIVGVTDFGVDPRGTGVPYLVMEYLEGRSLGDLLRDEGPMPPARALPLLEQVAQAVDHAHRHGVLHRDLKPLNIFIAEDSENAPRVKVLDFGLAHLMEGSEPARAVLTPAPIATGFPGGLQDGLDTMPIGVEFATRPLVDSREDSTVPIVPKLVTHDFDPPKPAVREVVGTPAYLAPEVLDFEKASPSVDVYSFGIMAYELMTGRLPFQGSVAELLDHQRKSPPPNPRRFNPELPEELESALLRPLAKRPADRPPTLQATVEALRRRMGEHDLHVWERREIPRRRRYALFAALASLVLAWALQPLKPIRIFENRLQDLRMSLITVKQADPRIVLVHLEEATLDDGTANFFERADRLVQGIEGILKAGASGVALDLILPKRFAESESLSRLVLGHRTRLVLGLLAAPGGQLKGWECLSPLTRSVLGSTAELASLFGLVNLDGDADGRIRTFRSQLKSSDGTILEPVAVRLFRHLSGSTLPASVVQIDHSVDPSTLHRVAWNEIPARLASDPDCFKGKLVLVGVDSPIQEDTHSIPSIQGRPGEVSGLAIHGLAVQTLLEDQPLRSLPAWIPGLIVLGLTGACGWAFLRFPQAWKAWCLTAVALAGFAILLLALGWQGILLPMAGPLLAAMVIIGSAALARRFLPQIPAPESPHES